MAPSMRVEMSMRAFNLGAATKVERYQIRADPRRGGRSRRAA
jgi:hypothetical protein